MAVSFPIHSSTSLLSMSSIAQLVGQLARVTDSQLCGPANDQQIAMLRSAYDAVPASLVELLSFANGEADSSFKSNGIVAFEAFINAEEIASESDFTTADSVYDGLNEFVSCQRIDRSENWRRGLIPISFGYDAHCVCIDMNPESQGTVGQILALQPVTGGISGVANGLEELLQTTLNIYQEKEFDFSDPDCPNLTLEDSVSSARDRQ